MITVLVAGSVHPVGGRPVRARNDALAVAMALDLAGADGVELLSIGTLSDAVARDYLALGAASIEVVDPGRSATVPLLAQRLADRSLVLTGMRSTDALGTGLLPYALAAALQRPMIGDVVGIAGDEGGWLVTQTLPKGARRRLRVSRPAVLAVSRTAPHTLRHAHASGRAGRIARTTAPIGLPPDADESASTRIVPVARHLQPLEAAVHRSGHDRMRAAVDTIGPSGTSTVLVAGTPRAKAQAILDYLRAHALVTF